MSAFSSPGSPASRSGSGSRSGSSTISQGATTAAPALRGVSLIRTVLTERPNVVQPYTTEPKNIQQDMGLSRLQDVVLSPAQQTSLRALEPVMQSCQVSCNAFSKRLSELTSHSDADRLAWRNRLRLHFNDKDIRLLQESLGQAQRTLSDALDETSALACTTVKYQKTFDQARLLTGNIDFHGQASTIYVGNAEARGKSRMFIGNMSAEAARDFWN